jgi:hypothetical protein
LDLLLDGRIRFSPNLKNLNLIIHIALRFVKYGGTDEWTALGSRLT